MAINGEALRLLRERTGWKAADFAAAADISLQYLCDIEAGRRKLKRNPELIRTFAQLLEVPTPMISVIAPGEVA